MYRTLGFSLLLLTLSFSGCQETEPSRVIVSLQIDSDDEGTWFYLYSIPRVKMGNLTILVGEVNETLPSVFSHQKHISKNEIDNIIDDEGYFTLFILADLKEVYWEYSCKLRISQVEGVEDNKYIAETLSQESGVEVEAKWNLPHVKALEFKE